MPSRSVVSDSGIPWTVALQTAPSLGMLQARILEWVAVLSSRGSSQRWDSTLHFTFPDGMIVLPPKGPTRWVLYYLSHQVNVLKWNCGRTSRRGQSQALGVRGRGFA